MRLWYALVCRDIKSLKSSLMVVWDKVPIETENCQPKWPLLLASEVVIMTIRRNEEYNGYL